MVSNFPREQSSFQIELDEGEKYYTNHTKLQVTKVRRKKVLWNIDKLKERLGKECCKDIINKTYTINDIDGLVKYLSRLDNVTVAGVTNPSGINQEVGGYVYMPENAIIVFPTGLVLDENGNPNIDIDETRISRNPIDIKIPLNKESAIKIFNSIDYELEWAIEYLNS